MESNDERVVGGGCFRLVGEWVMACAIAGLCVQGRAYPEEGGEARRQRRYDEAATALSKAQEAANKERTITIRTLDYQGNPVEGVPLVLSGSRYRAVVLPFQTKYHDVVSLRATTDVDGKATFGPVVLGEFSIGINAEGLPAKWDVDSGDEYCVPGPGAPVRDRGPRTAPGIDYQFYLHRYVGPSELYELPMKAVLNPPDDGTPVKWPLTSPDVGDVDARAAGADGIGEDFVVRYWRDPAKPYTLPPETGDQGEVPGVKGARISYAAPYWFELEARNGGLQEVVPAAADPQVAIMAPDTGYRQRVSWVHDPQVESASGDVGSLFDASGRKRWFWWVRASSKGSIYALVSFRCVFGYDSTVQRTTVELEGWCLVNPKPNDRLIERSINRRAQWIVGFTVERAEEWLKQMEPWRPYPAIPVQPLQPGWPPRTQNSAP